MATPQTAARSLQTAPAIAQSLSPNCSLLPQKSSSSRHEQYFQLPNASARLQIPSPAPSPIETLPFLRFAPAACHPQLPAPISGASRSLHTHYVAEVETHRLPHTISSAHLLSRLGWPSGKVPAQKTSAPPSPKRFPSPACTSASGDPVCAAELELPR